MRTRKLIKDISIAKLDPNKTYFLQIACDEINYEAMQAIHKQLKEEFNRYSIKNIVLFTTSEVECKFTEVNNNE